MTIVDIRDAGSAAAGRRLAEKEAALAKRFADDLAKRVADDDAVFSERLADEDGVFAKRRADEDAVLAQRLADDALARRPADEALEGLEPSVKIK